ncbi:hypothetical protein MMC29_001895 [Sticta canariensis]|nr:hypothetical protein [Sticta canariensis]
MWKPSRSGTPAAIVLADEGPRYHQTPIIPDDPTNPNSPSPPNFPTTSAPFIYSTPPTLRPPLLDQSSSETGATARAGTSPSTELTNRRRRRRSISSEGEVGDQPSDLTNIGESLQNEAGSSRSLSERPPSRKRRRFMSERMRLDPDSSTSNGSRHQSNGSTHSSLHKGLYSTTTNGHSSPPLGTSSLFRNGSSSTIPIAKAPSFFGHDREEVTRLIIQGLTDLGYHASADRLSQESGYEVESPTVAAFRYAVLQGDWREAESLLFGSLPVEDGGGVSVSNGESRHYEGLKFADGADQDELKFCLREQKYLELLEQGDLSNALQVLRHELTPLHQDIGKLHKLSSLIVCRHEDLKTNAKWDGARGRSRRLLLQELSKSISPSVMIPEHRLAVLLNQLKQNQISKCLYHNSSTSPSLFSDHMCDRGQFPLRTVLELSHNAGEVWFVAFSHNGHRLATSGQDSAVIIYDTSTFHVRFTLRAHTSHVAYVTWSPDDSKLITCSHDFKARVWDSETGRCILTIDRHTEPVTTAAWAPDGETFVTGSLGRQSQLCLWHLNGRSAYSWQTDYRIQDCAISPDGQRLVTISPNMQIFVYNFVTREEEYSILLKTKMTSLSISRDSRYMLINMTDNEVQLIDIETAEIVRRFLGQKQGDFVIRSSFGGADENLIISGSEDSKVYIWHKENGTLIETLEGHLTGCVNGVAWNPANPCMFASAGDDRKVRM